MKTYVLGPNAARAVKRMMRGDGEVSSRAAFGPGAVFDSEWPTPFEVRWSQSSNSGSGAWVIWLGDGLQLLSINCEAISLAEDLDPAGGDLPSGWWQLADVAATGSKTIWLSVRRTMEDGDVVTEVGFSTTQPTGDGLLVAQPIAQVSRSSADGSVAVKQLVSSAVVAAVPTYLE